MKLPTLSESASRTLRTVYAGLVTLIVAGPVAATYLPSGTPVAADFAAFLAGLTAVNRVILFAEDRGWVPALGRTPPRLAVRTADQIAKEAAAFTAVADTLHVPAAAVLDAAVPAVQAVATALDAAAAPPAPSGDAAP